MFEKMLISKSLSLKQQSGYNFILDISVKHFEQRDNTETKRDISLVNKKGKKTTSPCPFHSKHLVVCFGEIPECERSISPDSIHGQLPDY